MKNTVMNTDSNGTKTIRVCTVAMLRSELLNKVNHGLAKHKNNWFHKWTRTRSGTLSWDWRY